MSMAHIGNCRYQSTLHVTQSGSYQLYVHVMENLYENSRQTYSFQRHRYQFAMLANVTVQMNAVPSDHAARASRRPIQHYNHPLPYIEALHNISALVVPIIPPATKLLGRWVKRTDHDSSMSTLNDLHGFMSVSTHLSI